MTEVSVSVRAQLVNIRSTAQLELEGLKKREQELIFTINDAASGISLIDNLKNQGVQFLKEDEEPKDPKGNPNAK